MIENTWFNGALVASALVLLPSSLVYGAPPVNDDRADATPIPELPFTDVADTTEASFVGEDFICKQSGRTVWYTFTPMTDVVVLADTFGSDYATTIAVEPGGYHTDCTGSDEWPAVLAIEAKAGVTQYIMVGAEQHIGGELVFNLDVVPPPPDFDVTVDLFSAFDRATGEAIITGTMWCSGPGLVRIDGSIQQAKPGHDPVEDGFNEIWLACDENGGERSWRTRVTPSEGSFKSGWASVSLNTQGSDHGFVDYNSHYYDDLRVVLIGTRL